MNQNQPGLLIEKCKNIFQYGFDFADIFERTVMSLIFNPKTQTPEKGRHAALLPIRIFSCTNLGTCVVLTFPRTVYGTVFALPRLLYIFCCAQPRIASNKIKIS